MAACALLGVSSPAVARAAETIDLLYRVEDLMGQTSEGQRLISIYYEYSPNLARAILPDETTAQEGWAVVEMFLPGLEALVEGRGGEVTISQDQVEAVEAFLDRVSAVADPDLQRVIADERARRPLRAMVGLTMEQAWRRVNGYSLEWRSPAEAAGSQTVLEETFHVERGAPVLVEFVLRDFLGDPVTDSNLILDVLDGSGPLTIGSDPNTAPTLTDAGEYQFNLETLSLSAGPHDIFVWFNSPSGDPARFNLWIDEPADENPVEEGGEGQSADAGA